MKRLAEQLDGLFNHDHGIAKTRGAVAPLRVAKCAGAALIAKTRGAVAPLRVARQ